MISKLYKNKRGFTLIELIVVIAVLLVLVTIAVPKFMGQTQKATLTKHLASAKTIEDAANIYNIEHNRFPRLSETPYTSAEVIAFADKIHSITGEEVTLDPDGNYYDIDYVALKDYVSVPDDKDKGNYILQNPVGNVFFLEGIKDGRMDGVDFNIGNPDIDKGSSLNKYLANDEDFSGETDGSFKYIGSSKIVEIPHIIKGVPVTSYQYMFRGTNVEKVISTNKNVTSMFSMFTMSKSNSLDLLDLDTSGVTDMSGMFSNSQATSIEFSTFDTSNVTNMSGMFGSSNFQKLDLSNFNTIKVNDIRTMFAHCSASVIDLSTFDTNRITNIYAMFNNSKAKEVYVGTFGDTIKFSAYETMRPWDLKLIVK